MTQLTHLLGEAFGEEPVLTGSCWIRAALDEQQDDYGDVIQIVTAGGGRSDLIRRLRAEHPLDRDHHTQHDDRLLDVFTEAEAFSWAQHVARLGNARFVFEEGAPDLRVTEGWIEAKRLGESEVERAQLDQLAPALDRNGIVMRGPRNLGPIPDAVFRQLQSKIVDSERKWRRQPGGNLVVFFDVLLDFGVSFRYAREALEIWARQSSARHGARIVVCYMNDDWRNPLVDTGRTR